MALKNYNNYSLKELEKEKLILLGKIKALFSGIGIVSENTKHKLFKELKEFEKAYNKKNHKKS